MRFYLLITLMTFTFGFVLSPVTEVWARPSALEKKKISLEKYEGKKLLSYGKWCVRKKLYWEGCQHLEKGLKLYPSDKSAKKSLAKYEYASQGPVDEKYQLDMAKKKKSLYDNLRKKWLKQSQYAKRKKDAQAEALAYGKFMFYSNVDGKAPAKAIERSEAEVKKLIAAGGKTDTAWLGVTQLTFPKTLKMAWPEAQGGGWKQNVNISQYIWSTINENPSKWREGTKFMHHVMEINKDDPTVVQKAQGALGLLYHDMHRDWARGAYYWEKGSKLERIHAISLANCYWKLGNVDMAKKMLSRINFDTTRYGSAIKLWSDMDQFDKAIALAEKSGGSGAFAAAGDACFKREKYDEAKAYFQKVMGVPATGKNKILQHNQARAQLSIDNADFVKNFDLKNLKAGIYRDKAYSYNGPIEMEVTLKYGRITTLKNLKVVDKQYYASIIDTKEKIINKQSVKGIHATTGATVTSEAIIHAVTKALMKAKQ